MILVIGSAHLDILANITSKDTLANVDKVGTLAVTVGGTGYNIASALARQGDRTALLSALSDSYWSSHIIRAGLRKNRIDTKYIVSVKEFPESGFVALTHNHDLLSAVSCMPLETHSFSNRILEQAIASADLLVVDANLSTDTLLQAIDLALTLSKPVFGTCVSESKVHRLTRAALHKRALHLHLPNSERFNHGTLFEFISMNRLEALKVTDSVTPEICEVFGANHIVVTDAARGYDIYHRGGGYIHFDAPSVSLASPLGAGDALFAAFCAYAGRSRTHSLNDALWTDTHACVGQFLQALEDSQRGVEPPNRRFDPFSESTYCAIAICISLSIVSINIVSDPGMAWFKASLIAAPLLAGVGGSLLPSAKSDEASAVGRAIIGLIGSAFMCFSFIVLQLHTFQTDLTKSPPASRTELLLLAFVFGFAGGIASEPVIERLRRVSLPFISSARVRTETHGTDSAEG